MNLQYRTKCSCGADMEVRLIGANPEQTREFMEFDGVWRALHSGEGHTLREEKPRRLANEAE